MNSQVSAIPTQPTANWQDYVELCKPRVVVLMLLTAVVGMYMAAPGLIPLRLLASAMVGIALGASAAAVVNHLVDSRIDALMKRTERRPIVTGRVCPRNASIFAVILGCLSMLVLITFVNTLTAWLTLLTLVGYAGIYTLYLKHATPQNIVIGGAAGAAPPVLGWVAVTGHLDPQSLLLALIIFAWTPPHFWSLAIYRYQDYANAKVPMLPVTHGIAFTKLSIVLYTVLLCAVSLLPYVIGMSGNLYLITAIILDSLFLYYAGRLYHDESNQYAIRTFKYSLYYLMFIFVFLLADHYY